MRTVFLGTSGFAATVLRRLAASEHRPRLVVTPPDRPRGRGRRLASPPSAEAARELSLEVLQVATVNDHDAVERIGAVEPEVGAVCAFGQLVKDPLLSSLEMLNIHPSLLPRWRGAAPIERALMAGDSEIGVSVMKLTAGLDSGPVALQEPIAVDPEADFGDVEPRLAELGGELLVRALDLRAAGGLELTEQDDSRATYAQKIEPADRRLDPSRPAPELAATVRALTPHIGAFLELEGGARLGVRRAEAVPSQLVPGHLLAGEGELALGTADGVLKLLVVQPEGGKPMPADAYLRGHPLPSLAG